MSFSVLPSPWPLSGSSLVTDDSETSGPVTVVGRGHRCADLHVPVVRRPENARSTVTSIAGASVTHSRDRSLSTQCPTSSVSVAPVSARGWK
jgi:hypothetical protein